MDTQRRWALAGAGIVLIVGAVVMFASASTCGSIGSGCSPSQVGSNGTLDVLAVGPLLGGAGMLWTAITGRWPNERR